MAGGKHLFARIYGPQSLWHRGSAEIWAIGDQALVSGMNFVTNVLLARVLGFRQFGVFTLTWLVVLFVNSLQMALIVSPMMSVAPKQSVAEAPRYFGAVWLQQLSFALFSSLMMGLGLVAVTIIKPEWGARGLALPLAVAAFCFALQDFLRRYFFVCSQPQNAFCNDAISYGAQVAILLLAWGRFVVGARTALIIIAATSAAAVIVDMRKVGRLALPSAEQFWASVRRHWSMSKWLSASAVMQYATANTFVIAASTYFGVGAAGVLRAAKNIMGLTHIWFFGLENVMPMQAARALHASGTSGLRRYLRDCTLFWGAASATFAIVVSFRPGLWLGMFFGAKFAEYGFLLRWYALAYVIIFLGLPIRSGLRAMEKTRPVFWGYLVSSVFCVGCSAWITRTWGLVGAMAGLVTAQVLLQGISFAGLVLHTRPLHHVSEEPLLARAG